MWCSVIFQTPHKADKEGGADAGGGRWGIKQLLMKIRPFLCSSPLWPLWTQCPWPVQLGGHVLVAFPACALRLGLFSELSFPLADSSAYPDLRLMKSGHLEDDVALGGQWERDIFAVLCVQSDHRNHDQVPQTPLVHSISCCLQSQDGNIYLVGSRDCTGLP